MSCPMSKEVRVVIKQPQPEAPGRPLVQPVLGLGVGPRAGQPSLLEAVQLPPLHLVYGHAIHVPLNGQTLALL